MNVNWKRDNSAPDRLSHSKKQWRGGCACRTEFSMAELHAGTERQTDKAKKERVYRDHTSKHWLLAECKLKIGSYIAWYMRREAKFPSVRKEESPRNWTSASQKVSMDGSSGWPWGDFTRFKGCENGWAQTKSLNWHMGLGAKELWTP